MIGNGVQPCSLPLSISAMLLRYQSITVISYDTACSKLIWQPGGVTFCLLPFITTFSPSLGSHLCWSSHNLYLANLLFAFSCIHPLRLHRISCTTHPFLGSHNRYAQNHFPTSGRRSHQGCSIITTHLETGHHRDIRRHSQDHKNSL